MRSPARCHYESVEQAHAAAMPTPAVHVEAASTWGSGFSQMPTAPIALDGSMAARLVLKGEVLGDATEALAGFDSSGHAGEGVVVSCAGLIRVDFSAAGSILNWVAMRQAEGCHVQFRDVHRLVAAFFNVIGINEHARVVPRPI